MQPSQPFRATHSAPATGMATWAAPGDPAAGPRLDAHLPVQVLQKYGDWAQVMCSNGWTAWVDGRILVPIPVAAAPVAAPVTYAPVGAPVTYAPVGAPVVAPPPPVGSAQVVPPPAQGYGGVAVARRPYQFITPSEKTWPTAAGAALVVIATFLPWYDPGGGLDSINALDVPFVYLLSWKNGNDGGPGLGIVLILLAVASFMLKHLSGLEKFARIPAGVCIPATVMFVVQVNSYLGEFEGAPGVLDVLGIGVWPALIGAGLMAWGGSRT